MLKLRHFATFSKNRIGLLSKYSPWIGTYPTSSVPATLIICALRHIRPRLIIDVAKSFAVCIVGSRLDYCNSLFYSTSQRNFDRLQRVKNSLARVVTQASRRSSATELHICLFITHLCYDLLVNSKLICEYLHSSQSLQNNSISLMF